jgi:hypothetical protein
MYCIFVFLIITLYLPSTAIISVGPFIFFPPPFFFFTSFSTLLSLSPVRPFFHFHLSDPSPNSSPRRNFRPTLLMYRHSSASAHYSSSSTTQPSRCLPIQLCPECPDCGMKLVRLVSNSTLNPGKIYYKCSTNKSVLFSIHSILGFSISTGFSIGTGSSKGIPISIK